jgi:hypothetical protein
MLVGCVDDFCKEKGCLIYPTKMRVNSVENPSNLIKHQKLTTELYCREKYSYTNQDFLEWLPAKEPSYRARKLFRMI